MISPIVKVFARPIVRALDALLQQLQRQIQDGQKDQAMQTVNELRDAIKEASKYVI